MVWTIMLVETLFAEQLSIIRDLFHAVLHIKDLCVPCEFLFVRSSYIYKGGGTNAQEPVIYAAKKNAPQACWLMGHC